MSDACANPDTCTCGESTPQEGQTPGPCYWAENAPGAQSQVHRPRPFPADVSDVLVKVLAEHDGGMNTWAEDQPFIWCKCGFRESHPRERLWNDTQADALHRAHVAAVLSERFVITPREGT